MTGEISATTKKKTTSERGVDEYLRLLKFYYLPIFVLVIFFVIMIFGLIPSLNSIYNNYSQRNTVKKAVERQEVTIANLVQLKNDSNEINQYLESINTIAPVQVTNVTEFQESIKTLATTNGIATKQANTRELIYSEDGSQSGQVSYLQLVEVPSDFVFAGSFEDIRTFLGALYEQDEFIVIEEMSFAKPVNSSDWELSITLNKYQFQINETVLTGSDQTAQTAPNYLAEPESAKPDQNVIDFIDKKYLNKNEP
ncbi:type 4a pilus biogenesis protein PilO [Candidatus Dojkabacteria bacterium]|nr:type 4a pilus biogenesis protein PilO [Candidatus Dojkabacteria bacterium]